MNLDFLAKYALSTQVDKLEVRRRRREKELEEWVQDNPQWWAVGLATVGQSSMDFTFGMVDALRFGEGMAEGGLKGGAKDVLRLIGLIGPVGRVAAGAGAAGKAAFGHLLGIRLAVRVRGVTGPCTFQAVNNAMSIAKGGKSIFVTLREMAKARGVPLKSLAKNAEGRRVLSAWVDDLVPTIKAHGATVREMTGLARIEQVVQHAARDRVIIFAFRTTVRAVEKGVPTLKPINHSIIVVKDSLGRLRYADYGKRFFSSIEELCAHHWGPVTAPVELIQKGMSGLQVMRDSGTLLGPYMNKLLIGGVLIVEGWTAIETAEDGVDLAVEVEPVAVPVAGASAAPPDVKAASYAAYRDRKSGRRVIRMPEVVIRAGSGAAPPVHMLAGVQFRLNALGFGAGPEDGIMGIRTKRAVISFQMEHHPPLATDGVPGPKTQAKLAEVCGY